MLLSATEVQKVEYDDDKLTYVVFGTATDVRKALCAAQELLQVQIDKIFGPDDKHLFEELKGEYRNLLD